MSGWTPPLWVDRVTGVAWRFLVVVAAIAVIVGLISAIDVVVMPLFLGLLFASFLVPLSRWLVGLRVPRNLAAAISALVLLGVFVLATWIGLKAIADQWDQIPSALDDATDEIEEWIVDSGALEEGQAADLDDALQRAVGTVVRVAIAGAVVVFSSVAELVTTFFLSLFVTFFYVKDGEAMWRWVVSRAGEIGGSVDQLGRRAFTSLAQYIRGQSIVALVDAVLIGLGAWILGVPFVSAIAVLTFFLSFIPILGAVIAGAFACLLALADQGVGQAIAMLVVVVVVQQLESNLLQPVILGKATGLHPIVVVLVVVGAGAVSGVVGIFIAVPITAALVAVGSELRQEGWFSEDIKSRLRSVAGLAPETPADPTVEAGG
jgi:predicted PurR-regulated permease PerM